MRERVKLLLAAVALGAGLLLVSCAQFDEEDVLVEVDVRSEPENARVYFVPTLEFSDERMADPSWLGEYEISQGRAPTTTVQYEQSYAVVFVREGDTVVKRNVRVIAGQPNTVRATFDTVSRAPEEGG